jgi:flagellar assembly factor FliW
MNIETRYHGDIELAQDEIITFEKGIPGFEDEKQFALLPFGEDTPFYILQSTNTPELAFVLTEPFTYFKDYEFDLPKDLQEELAIKDKTDVVVFAILTVKDPFSNSTANLQAPVVINKKQQKGKQLLLNNTSYQTKHLLFPEASKVKEEVK